MTDQTNSSTPSGNAPSAPSIAPAPAPAEMGGGSFIRDRSRQIMERQQAQAQGEQPAADAQQQQQQQTLPGGQTDDYPQEVKDAIARDAEAQVRRNTLPKTEAEYLAKNSDSFKLPEGVKFEFNESDPMLANARRVAMKHGWSQEAFSDLLDVYAAGNINSQTSQIQMRQKNLDALGAAGPQRVDAVAQWLNARAGKDGAQVAAFLKAWPSAPIVKAMETLIRQFSSQGGSDFSQSHRETAEATSGRIANYDQLSFTGRRVAQMQDRMRTDPSYGRRGQGERK